MKILKLPVGLLGTVLLLIEYWQHMEFSLPISIYDFTTFNVVDSVVIKLFIIAEDILVMFTLLIHENSTKKLLRSFTIS